MVGEEVESIKDQGVIVKNIDTRNIEEDHLVVHPHHLNLLLRRRTILKREEKPGKDLDLTQHYVL